EAVEDAQDGDELEFDVETRALRNTTRGKTYEPKPLTPKEEEIRAGGGIIAMGRRDVAATRGRSAAVEFPNSLEARHMTATEQILWAHRVDKKADVRPGATIQAYADLLPASDGTAPFAIHTFKQIVADPAVQPRL